MPELALEDPEGPVPDNKPVFPEQEGLNVTFWLPMLVN